MKFELEIHPHNTCTYKIEYSFHNIVRDTHDNTDEQLKMMITMKKIKNLKNVQKRMAPIMDTIWRPKAEDLSRKRLTMWPIVIRYLGHYMLACGVLAKNFFSSVNTLLLAAL